MKKLFALALVVFGLAACQTESEGLDVNMDGTTTISVVLPEDAMTRAGYTDSAQSGLANTDGETIRVVMRIYDENGRVSDNRYVDYLSGNERTVNFDVRLVPNRQYTFVAWADQVISRDDVDKYFVTSDLSKVTFSDDTWTEMNENRDAYTATHTEANFTSASNITLTLTRPFAKLRVVTTDMVELKNLGIKPPFYATMSYTEAVPTSFNAISGTIGDDYDSEAKVFSKFVIKDYASNTTTNKTLFTDYVLIPESNVVKFTLDVYQDAACTKLIKSNAFTTDIPVKRNNLTTIQGNILTDGTSVNVTVDEVFENQNNATDAPYYQEAVNNAVDLIKALKAGKKIIVLNDITVTAVDVALATRSGEAIYPVINLNGFTITIENEDTGALVNLNGGTLTVEGNGEIKADNGALVEGTTVVTEGADVDARVAVDENGDSAVKSGLEALVFICKNGGEFNFTEDLASGDALLVTTTNPVVINGADFNLTSSATRAIRIDSSSANVVVNDLNIVVTTERVGTNDVRGISINPELSNVELTLNNCSVDFTHKTGNDWTYAVNVSGNGTGHKVTVNGGTYNGANVINAHGAKNTIVVKNATLTSLYPIVDVYYGACIWVLQNQESSVYAEGNTFNGDNAIAFNLGTGTALEEKNNTDNTKLVAAKVGSTYYYNVAEAINAAEDGATIKVLHNHDCNVGATVPAGKTLTLDLNGKTVAGTDTITGSFGLITNKGNLTITGNGKITLVAKNNRGWNAYSSVISNTVGGKLVVENGTIEHLGGTDMAYGIDNLTNGKGTYAETVINGGNIKSTYRAIRMFLNGIEADNILTVNGGTIEGANKSIWMQDPSKNANTGTLVVNEGATLNGDVYLFVTAGSTEWPVEVSIAASAVNGEVLTGNVPAGYEVVEKDGVWTVVAYTKVSTVEELTAALKACKPIILGADITVTEKWDNRFNGAKVTSPITIDGNGKILKFACEVQDMNYIAAFRFEAPAVVKNLTFDLSEVKNRCAAISTKGNIIVDNCTFIGSKNYTGCRGIRFGEGAGNAISNVEVVVINSTFTNLGRGITDNENGQDAKSVTITDNTCTNAHVYVSAHDSIVFTGNTLVNSAANFRSYTSAEDATVVATDNTLDANMAQYNIIRGFAAANIDCQEGFTIVE